MALILLDGCEEVSGGGAPIIGTGTLTTVAGRTGLAFRPASGAIRYVLTPALESDTLTVGFAMNIPTTIISAGNVFVIRSDALATTHLALQVQTNGSVNVLRGAATIVASTAAGAFPIGAWFYVEVQAKLADSGGFVTLRVDGTQVATFTGDTKNAGTKTVFDSMDWQPGSIGPVSLYDDIYVQNGASDTFLGPISVEMLLPDGNGNASQWVGSDSNSVNNYLLVNETPPGVGTHTKSSTAGEIDQYTVADLKATAGTIVGVCHQATMYLGAAGSATFAFVNRRTADTVGATQTCTVQGNGASFQQCYTTDPETGAAWTIANVNALQTGVQVI